MNTTGKFFLLFLIFSNCLNAGVWEKVDSVIYYNQGSHYPVASPFKAIDCADSLNCVALALFNLQQPLVRSSSDGGKNWSTILWDSSSWSPGMATSVFFKDTSFCFIGGSNGKYWLSNDNRRNWEIRYIDSMPGDRVTAAFLGNHGVIVNGANIYFSKDKAKTFKKSKIHWDRDTSFWNKGIVSFSLVDTNTCFLIFLEFKLNTLDTILYKTLRTTDFGNNWTSFDFEGNPPPNQIKFFDSLNGIAACCFQNPEITHYYPLILKTSNAGKSWDTVFIDKKNAVVSFDRIRFFDKRKGVIFGSKGWGQTHWTNDGGNSWIQHFQESNFKGWVTDMTFVSEFSMFACTYDSYICKYHLDPTYVITLPEEKQTEIFSNIIEGSFEINLQIEATKDDMIKIQLFDFLGNKVDDSLISIDSPGKSKYRYSNPDKLNKGLYFLKIFINGKIENHKILFI